MIHFAAFAWIFKPFLKYDIATTLVRQFRFPIFPITKNNLSFVGTAIQSQNAIQHSFAFTGNDPIFMPKMIPDVALISELVLPLLNV